MEIANIVSERSTCKRLKVGSVIVTEDGKNIVSIGYNGGFSGDSNNECTEVPTKCGDLHSEINALIKSEPARYFLYVTLSPCDMCAKAIVNSGIKVVYYQNKYRDDSGLKILKRGKVKVKQLCVYSATSKKPQAN